MSVKEQNWTHTIEPPSALLNFQLGEIWRYRHLITIFVRRDFVAGYKQTILGPIWLILPPLLTTMVFTVVFGHLAGLSTNGTPQILFYMSGIVLWGYFNACVVGTASTFTSQTSLFSKVYFPRLTVPLATLIFSSITSSFQFIMFCGFLIYYWVSGQIPGPTWALLLVPPLFVIIMMLGLGFGIMASAVTAKYRDLSFLIGFGMQLMMYMTTIIYPLSSVSPAYRTIALINPMSSVVESFRFAIIGIGAVPVIGLAYALVVSVLVMAAGIALFNLVERTVMDII